MEHQNNESDSPGDFLLKMSTYAKQIYSSTRSSSLSYYAKCSNSTAFNVPLRARCMKKSNKAFTSFTVCIALLFVLSGLIPYSRYVGFAAAVSVEDTNRPIWQPPVVLKLSPKTTNFVEYPHSEECFTEGYLMYEPDKVLESCGLRGRSFLLNYTLSSGTVLDRQRLPANTFAEGLTMIDKSIFLLTYTSRKTLVLDRDTKKIIKELPFDTKNVPHWKEGWGMTKDGNSTIYATDGEARTGILEMDATTLKVKRYRKVFCGPTANEAQAHLNELEFIPTERGGILLANIWLTYKIAVIDVPTGACIAILEFTDPELPRKAGTYAERGMNGILWHPSLGDDIVVTGKNWKRALRFPILASLRNISAPTRQTSRDLLKPVKSEFLLFFSFLCGVCYTLAWVISFYPQVWMNFKRKRVDGMSFDLTLYNLVGYVAYSSYTVVQYIAQQAASAKNAVEPQDMFFAVHSLFICMVLGFQCLIYYRGTQKLGNICLGLCGLFIIGTLVLGLFAARGIILWFSTSKTTHLAGESIWQHFIRTLTFFAYLGYVKATITIVKYIPQVHLNFVNKSTEGMSILNFTLDMLGGILSLLQNAVDAWNYSDISFLVDNVPKLVIGIAGLCYDTILLFQHYVLYRHHYKPVPDVEIQLSPISSGGYNDGSFPYIETTKFTKLNESPLSDSSSSSSPSTIDPFQ